MLNKVQSKSLPGNRLLNFGRGIFIKRGWGLGLLLMAVTLCQSGGALTPLDEEQTEETWEEIFIKSDIFISQWLDSTAEGIDLFLAGKEVSNKKNNSHVVVENSSFSVSGDNFKNTTSVSVNLRLPNLEEYWQLKFSTYDEFEEKRGVQNGYLRSTPREKNYGASLGLFRKLGTVRTAFQPRVELSDPLKVSHSLSFESIADLKTYVVNPKLEFFATPDRGTGIYLATNVSMGLTKVIGLTFVNYGEYVDKQHNFTAGNGFSFGHHISNKNSFSYTWMFFSNNRDNYHLDGYSLSAAWNQVVYKKILDTQLIPHLDFSKDNSFRGVPGIILNLLLNF